MITISNFRRPFAASFKSSKKFAILINTGEVELLTSWDEGEVLRKNISDMGLKSAQCLHINKNNQVVILDGIQNKVMWFDMFFNFLGELCFNSEEIVYFKRSLFDKELYIILKDSKKVISISEEITSSFKTILDYSSFPELYSSSIVLRVSKNEFLFLDSKKSYLHSVIFEKKKIISCKNFLNFGRNGRGYARNPTDINQLNNSIIINDNDNYLLQCFDLNLEFKHQIGGKGDSNSKFDLPVAGCVSNNTLHICDQNNDRIVRYHQNSKTFEEIIIDQFKPGNLSRPSGITFNNDLLYVADRSNSKIQIFDKDLNFISLLNTNKTLHRPSSIACLDQCSKPVIAIIERRDGDNSSLSLYEIKKDFSAKYIEFKLDPNIFLHDPQDLDADSEGKIYIANTLNRNLIKVNRSGEVECSADLAKISNNPRILIKCVNIRHYDNHIFTADFDNKIIYEFNESLNYLSSIDLSHERRITCIRSIFATPEYLLIAVRGDHEVLKINYHGEILQSLELENISSCSWNHPVKISYGKEENIYISDKENDRIILFNSKLKAITLSRNI